MMVDQGMEVHLISRPRGTPTPSDFAMVEAPVTAPTTGQVMVRNSWLSVDPYMRGRMKDVKSYVPPFRLDQPMEGGAVGEVVSSQDPGVPVGTTVLHGLGWREYATVDTKTVRVVDPVAAPASAYLSVLGMTGLTAYTGLTAIAPVKQGDVVFISGAAGAVGLAAGVLARELGASTVIGSAGGPQKAARLVEDFGYDASIDYRAGDLSEQLGRIAPDGIDVYLDNVGGDHLRAAIQALRPNGHVALCGAISGYNAEAPAPGPDNLFLAISKRLSLRGYIVSDHNALYPEYTALATRLLTEGKLKEHRTVVNGIANAVEGFIGMLGGVNTGKMLIKLNQA